MRRVNLIRYFPGKRRRRRSPPEWCRPPRRRDCMRSPAVVPAIVQGKQAQARAQTRRVSINNDDDHAGIFFRSSEAR